MDSKNPKTWNEDDEVKTIELDKASGGAAGTKSIPSQGGGDADDGTVGLEGDEVAVVDQLGWHSTKELGVDFGAGEIDDGDAELFADGGEHVAFVNETETDQDAVQAVLRSLAGGQSGLQVLLGDLTPIQ